jgi:outer membrane protein OmpA-like peptidoglycan-associated protein
MRVLRFLPLTLLVAGCGSSPPPELVQARSAYEQAANGPANRYAPADVESAKQTLGVAERSYDQNGDSQQTRDIAYAAERQARIAEARARTVAAIERRQKALTQAQQLRERQARTAEAQLSEAQKALESQRQALEHEQQARADAERRAAQAAADLARIATVKQEPQGMVITLPGGVLFASGKAEVLPAAQSKLSQVADALSKQELDAKIKVEGYTDSRGATSFNQDLSQRRADAVRDYFVAHGIAADRITAEGFGPAKPVADNATAEGRANNRRVEIVVENREAGVP